MTAVSLPRAASNIVVNTPPGVASNFAAINRRMSQASAGQPTTVVRITRKFPFSNLKEETYFQVFAIFKLI